MHLIDVALVLTLLNLEASTTAGRDKKGKAIEKSHTLSICPIQYTIIIFKRRI